MLVQYLGHHGDDLLVVNCARVSMGKWKTEFDSNDEKLIEYLARENHFMPFCHPHITMRFTAPIFVARQLAKHQIGFSWSEESLRYITADGKVYLPEEWRKQAPNIKQGSLNEPVEVDQEEVKQVLSASMALYDSLIEKGVCKEQARMVLPLNTEVTWIWTGSLSAWSRVYNLRIDSHAQEETRLFAQAIDIVIRDLFPVSWRVLTQQARSAYETSQKDKEKREEK